MLKLTLKTNLAYEINKDRIKKVAKVQMVIN